MAILEKENHFNNILADWKYTNLSRIDHFALIGCADLRPILLHEIEIREGGRGVVMGAVITVFKRMRGTTISYFSKWH